LEITAPTFAVLRVREEIFRTLSDLKAMAVLLEAKAYHAVMPIAERRTSAPML
jgi:hypothetical protein